MRAFHSGVASSRNSNARVTLLPTLHTGARQDASTRQSGTSFASAASHFCSEGTGMKSVTTNAAWATNCLSTGSREPGLSR